ncbi:hypothetical protein BJP36_39975 [Moorena producens JHB]|uniref:Uncharacterized protein n=1 Tax=Moorena producens (strain JHB) TaxID=1454205 RepID=A0A9Q9UV74_MOOP1|nr:hypothetical protein [Moorena producens]WAN68556.1 hypothetical protein BJP36_39975 [Moorena producens JHB]
MRECLFPVPYSLLRSRSVAYGLSPCSLFPVPCSLCYKNAIAVLKFFFYC